MIRYLRAGATIWLVPAVICAALLWVVASGQWIMLRVSERSMMPHYCDGDLVVARTWLNSSSSDAEQAIGKPIVVATSDGRLLIKRLIGASEDTIYYSRSTVVRTLPTAQSHVSENRIPPKWGKVLKVPNGHIFIAGDNLTESEDSRYYGTLPAKAIVATVKARIPIGSKGCQ